MDPLTKARNQGSDAVKCGERDLSSNVFSSLLIAGWRLRTVRRLAAAIFVLLPPAYPDPRFPYAPPI